MSVAARWSGLALGPWGARAMATASRYWGQVGSRDNAWTFSDKLPYGCGACVGRGSVVGDGAGVTVCTDGPVLVVSPVRSVVVWGYIHAITATATNAARTSGSQLPKAFFGRPRSAGAFGSCGSRGFWYVMGDSSVRFPANSPPADIVPNRRGPLGVAAQGPAARVAFTALRNL